MSTKLITPIGTKPLVFDVEGEKASLVISDEALQSYTGCMYEDTFCSLPREMFTPIIERISVFLANEEAHARLRSDYNIDFQALSKIMEDPLNAY